MTRLVLRRQTKSDAAFGLRRAAPVAGERVNANRASIDPNHFSASPNTFGATRAL